MPGTYFYHSHVGLQLDRALSGSLVIDPAEETLSSDADLTLVLDDWLTITPEEAIAAMSQPGRMGGMMGRSTDPPYAGYLINGRITAGTEPLRVTRGQRIRLRLINAGAATTFRCGIEGHRLEVTHADGQPVAPVLVDSLVVGAGERYDVIVTADNPGAWPLVAGPVDGVVPGVVAPFVYTGSPGVVTPPVVWPPRLRTGRVLRYADLQPLNLNATETRIGPARTIPLELAGGMMGSNAWTINGQAYPNASPFEVERDESIRFSMFNRSMVRHRMHLHGHFFRLLDPVTGRATGPVKDTVLVESMMGRVDVEWVANNPGRWFLHCHNAYHMEAGMARVVDVRWIRTFRERGVNSNQCRRRIPRLSSRLCGIGQANHRVWPMMDVRETTMRLNKFVTGIVVGCAAVVMSAMLSLAGPMPQGTPPVTPAKAMHQPGMAGMAGMDAKCQAMMADHGKMMPEMKGADERLDSLVVKMNAAAGLEKANATAAVVNEMVTQRRTMRDGMMKMQNGMMTHMMEHMQAGKDSMAMCPMMKPMGGMKH